jgi:phosphoribosylformylglycinamidine (FGAM) synthase PurS component
MRIGTILVLGLWTVLFSFAQSGQATRGSTKSGAQKDDGRIPIVQAAQELEKQFSAKILVDPSLTARVKPPQAETLERALDEIVGQVSGVVWRKVYTNKVLGEEPQPEKVINAVRALLNIDLGGVLVVDTRANLLNSFVGNYPLPAGFEQGLEQMQPPFNSKPLYVILEPRPRILTDQKGTRMEQFARLQQQLMEMLARMTPEERAQALRTGFQMWLNADPELRTQMMFEGLRMSFEYWQSLTPEQQQEMMEMGRKWFEQYFGGGGEKP